jgi:hypothetical protein
MKSNRSGGEDDLALAIEHFRVYTLQGPANALRKISSFIRIDGILGMPWHKRIHSNPKTHWHGQQIELKKTAKQSLDSRG